MSYDPNAQEGLDELFAESPSAAIAAIAQVIGQQYQNETAAQVHAAYTAGAERSQAVLEGLGKAAYYQADQALREKWGPEWSSNRDSVVAFINEHPEVYPEEVALDPQAAADRLDDIFRMTREDIRQADERESFDRIRAAGTLSYQDLMSPRRNESEE